MRAPRVRRDPVGLLGCWGLAQVAIGAWQGLYHGVPVPQACRKGDIVPRRGFVACQTFVGYRRTQDVGPALKRLQRRENVGPNSNQLGVVPCWGLLARDELMAAS